MEFRSFFLAEALHEAEGQQAIYIPPFECTFLNAFMGDVVHP